MLPWVTIKKYLKPILTFALRVAGIVAVYKICTAYDWKNVGQLISWRSVLILAGASATYAVKQLVDALRSKRLAAALSVPISFALLLKFNIQSVAFDFALPLPQAEEFYRFGRLMSYTSRKTAALLAVGIRATGLFATVCSLMATVAFTSLKLNPVFNFHGVSTFWRYFIIADLAIAALIVSFLFIRARRGKRPEIMSRGVEWARTIGQSLSAFKYHLFESTGLAFLSQFVYACVIYFLCVGNGADIAFYKVFLIVPLVYMGSLIPVGMAGLGIKEAVIAWSLHQFGVPQEIAGNIALFHFVMMISWLLLGAVLLLTERKAIVAVSPGQ